MSINLIRPTPGRHQEARESGSRGEHENHRARDLHALRQHEREHHQVDVVKQRRHNCADDLFAQRVHIVIFLFWQGCLCLLFCFVVVVFYYLSQTHYFKEILQVLCNVN